MTTNDEKSSLLDAFAIIRAIGAEGREYDTARALAETIAADYEDPAMIPAGLAAIAHVLAHTVALQSESTIDEVLDRVYRSLSTALAEDGPE